MTTIDEAMQSEREAKLRRGGARVRRVLLVGLVLAVAITAMVVWTSTQSGPPERTPWSVWAVPIAGSSISIGGTGKSVEQYGSVAAEPGGAPLPGHWSSGGQVSWTGSAEPRVFWRESRTPGAVLRGLRSVTYEPTGVERVGSDGRTWTAFVSTLHPAQTTGGAPDPRCVGTWEITSDRDAVTRVELRAAGTAHTPGSTRGALPLADGTMPYWSVRDGTLVIVGGPGGDVVGLLAEDAQSFVGRRDTWALIRGKRVR